MAEWSAPSFSLTARDVRVALGGIVVLDGVDVGVTPGTRLGVVGPNGVGKSTLLRVLAGLEQPDSGVVHRSPPSLRVGYLPQDADRSAEETVRQWLARRTGVARAQADLERSAALLAGGQAGADEAYADALEGFLASGGGDLDARIRTTCSELGLPSSALDAPTASLSGGQAARVALAAVLLARFDVMLLDEPTNDLDFAGLERIERFVDERAGGFVVVSHDRAFLERSVTRVLELDEHSRTGTEYGGGWVGYLEARETARRHAGERYAEYQAQRSGLEERARTQRSWAVQGVRRAQRGATDGDKFVREFRTASSERVAAKARATERAVERLEAVEKPWQGWELRLELAAAPRSGDVVMELAGAVVDRGAFRLGPLDVEIAWGERVAIVGPNGAGKTTLLLALLGRLPLVAGSRRQGPSVVVGEMDQARRTYESARPLVDEFVDVTGATVESARSTLAKFGLGADHVDRRASSLSPGERTRACLAQFSLQGVNCLVLDEPTNHLDLPAIEQVEVALDRWEGTLLLVTHDRRLLEKVWITRTIGPTGAPVDGVADM